MLSKYTLDFMEGGRVVLSVEFVGDVAVIMWSPISASSTSNLCSTSMPLPLQFQNVWSGLVRPSNVVPKERSPIELQKLIIQYLSESWELVACGITTTILEILHAYFVGSEVIVIDDSMHCTEFLYR